MNQYTVIISPNTTIINVKNLMFFMVIICDGPIIFFYWANATFTSKFVINKFVKRTDIIAINDFLFQMFMMVEIPIRASMDDL